MARRIEVGCGMVYPRVCGGTPQFGGCPVMLSGLSPRVRGNHPTTTLGNDLRGSIPACAGEPSTSPTPTRKARVYPRVCGGTGIAADEGEAVLGLSPRVRGNRR